MRWRPWTRACGLTTGAEFAERDAPATPAQIRRVLPIAKTLLPLGEPVETSAWMGSRPCFADSRPVIGRAPGHPGLWLAYGHGHVGLSLGPVTGRLIAEMVLGETPFCDPLPYAAERRQLGDFNRCRRSSSVDDRSHSSCCGSSRESCRSKGSSWSSRPPGVRIHPSRPFHLLQAPRVHLARILLALLARFRPPLLAEPAQQLLVLEVDRRLLIVVVCHGHDLPWRRYPSVERKALFFESRQMLAGSFEPIVPTG